MTLENEFEFFKNTKRRNFFKTFNLLRADLQNDYENDKEIRVSLPCILTDEYIQTQFCEMKKEGLIDENNVYIKYAECY